MSCTYCGCDPEANHVCERHQNERPVTPSSPPNVENLTSNPVPVAPADYIVRDSGQRHQFESGSLRDTTTGKTDYSRALDGPLFERLAAHLTRAETKYPDVRPGVPNWTLINTEEELVRYRKSAVRHFIQWYRGDTDEDHFAATVFNMNGCCYLENKLKEKA